MYQGHKFMAKYAGYSELGDITELDVHEMMAKGRRKAPLMTAVGRFVEEEHR